jgi:hypothetical protein
MKKNEAERDVWYHEGLRFECTQCGNCCTGPPGYVWVTEEEIRRISEFNGRTDEWLDEGEVRRVGVRYSLTERSNGDCIFLKNVDGKRICSIYPVRPIQCRTWPFWDINIFDRESWDDSAEVTPCPGMNHGRHYTVDEIERQLERKAPLKPEDTWD